VNKMKTSPCVVLGVTGSIAAFKAAHITSLLRQKGAGVHVIMTREAEAFVAPLTFQALSGRKVLRSLFDPPEAWDIEHVSLAEQADLVLIAPATANVIGKLAAGICDDLLTCVVTATRAPVFLAPAMNDGMYANTIVRDNIARLKRTGFEFLGPRSGRLACGSVGEGRMSEPEDIVAAVLSRIGKKR